MSAPPGPPVLSVAPLSSSNTLQFYWTPPVVGPNPPLLGYNISCIEYPALGPFVYGPNERYATITGLTNGVDYTFQINASNSAGTSSNVAWRTFQPGSTVPNPPSSVSVALASLSNSVVVSWTPPSVLPDSTIAWYALKGYTNILSNAVVTIGALGTQRNLVITGVPIQTSSFQFAVQAVNYPGWSLPVFTDTIGGVITPAIISGLSLWLDGSDNTTVVKSGANVTQWKDKSTNAYTAVNSGTITTSTLNSKQVINFAANRMTINSFSFRTRFTMIFLVNTNSSSSRGFMMYQRPSGYNFYIYTANCNLLFLNPGGDIYDGTITGCSGSPVQTNQWTIFSIGYDGNTNRRAVNYAVNGTPRTTIPFSLFPTDNSQSLLLTMNDSTFGDTTLLAEVIYYNESITTANRQLMEGYLAWKWGIQSVLPANHPYKNNQP